MAWYSDARTHSSFTFDYAKSLSRFRHYAELLEYHYRDMQDIEFTIENEKLYILQTRNGKRTAAATVKIGFCRLSQRKSYY